MTDTGNQFGYHFLALEFPFLAVLRGIGPDIVGDPLEGDSGDPPAETETSRIRLPLALRRKMVCGGAVLVGQ